MLASAAYDHTPRWPTFLKASFEFFAHAAYRPK
jgi:hypothetical protein